MRCSLLYKKLLYVIKINTFKDDICYGLQNISYHKAKTVFEDEEVRVYESMEYSLKKSCSIEL